MSYLFGKPLAYRRRAAGIVGDGKYFKKISWLELPQLKEGDSDKHLSPAAVKSKHETPRSYLITDETGKEYRRNRRYIYLTEEPPITINDDDSNDSEPVTMESIVNFPSVTEESDSANSEPNPPDNDVPSGPRRSTRVRSVPSWPKDYVM